MMILIVNLIKNLRIALGFCKKHSEAHKFFLFYVKEILESTHTEYFSNILIDVRHTDCATLCFTGSLQLHEEMQAGRRDIFHPLAELNFK